MPSENSRNPAEGKWFQEVAGGLPGEHFSVSFLQNHAIPIGRPRKGHRFDLVSEDLKRVGPPATFAESPAGPSVEAPPLPAAQPMDRQPPILS